ncbi:hypothetical protein ACX122_06920 [Kosakonia cowanii]
MGKQTIEELESQVKQLELSVAAERAWEKTMMRACGEDGPLSVAGKFNQLVAENAALKAAFDKPDAWLSWHSVPPTFYEPDRGGEYLKVHEAPGEKNDDGSDSWAVFRAPEIKTPATDSILASLRAEGAANAVPEGYVLMPKQIHLDADAVECICSHGGDGGYNYGDFTDVVLWVGEVENDDGSKTHGLNVSSADYPEEGSINLCEFAAQLRSKSEVQS